MIIALKIQLAETDQKYYYPLTAGKWCTTKEKNTLFAQYKSTCQFRIKRLAKNIFVICWLVIFDALNIIDYSPALYSYLHLPTKEPHNYSVLLLVLCHPY